MPPYDGHQRRRRLKVYQTLLLMRHALTSAKPLLRELGRSMAGCSPPLPPGAIITGWAVYFASGLLMPSGPFERELRRLDDGLDAVLALAERCVTSRTATAIRYASLTRGTVGVIVSRGETVKFAFLSEAMKSLKDIAWPRKGSALPRDSLMARFNAAPAQVRAAERDQGDTDLAGRLGGRSALRRCSASAGTDGH